MKKLNAAASKKLRVGGVMRCCVHTLNEAKGLKEVDGAILPCLFCSFSLIFKDGAWEWNRLDLKAIQWPDGQPCGHPGCLSHLSHPCEGCGRIGGRGAG